jgi:membrane dipeptidase
VPGSTWIADAHVDLLLEVAARRTNGEENPFARHWLPALRAGGVRLQICPIYVGGDLVPDGALRSALRLAGAFHDAMRQSPGSVFQVSSVSGLDEAKRGEPGTPVTGLEGPQDYPAVADGLRRGHGEETVAALLHGNLVRFLRRALPDETA